MSKSSVKSTGLAILVLKQISDNIPHMNGGQNFLLPAIDMGKVGGPLSVVKACMCESFWGSVS